MCFASKMNINSRSYAMLQLAKKELGENISQGNMCHKKGNSCEVKEDCFFANYEPNIFNHVDAQIDNITAEEETSDLEIAEVEIGQVGENLDQELFKVISNAHTAIQRETVSCHGGKSQDDPEESCIDEYHEIAELEMGQVGDNLNQELFKVISNVHTAIQRETVGCHGGKSQDDPEESCIDVYHEIAELEMGQVGDNLDQELFKVISNAHTAIQRETVSCHGGKSQDDPEESCIDEHEHPEILEIGQVGDNLNQELFKVISNARTPIQSEKVSCHGDKSQDDPEESCIDEHVDEYHDDPDWKGSSESDSSGVENRSADKSGKGVNNNEDSTVYSEGEDVLTKGKFKKRKRNPQKWKRNIAKHKRLHGETYKSAVSLKIIPKRIVKSACPDTCRMKCKDKINEDQRVTVLNDFWKENQSWDQRRQLIALLINIKPIHRQRPRNNSSTSDRTKSREYYLMIESQKIRVCKTMFLNTLSVSDKFVCIALSKMQESSIVKPDRRGQHTPGNKSPEEMIKNIVEHISSFPSYESHYSRERSMKKYLNSDLNISKMFQLYLTWCDEKKFPKDLIGKEWLYRDNFNTKFNLSFHQPSNDTCSDCDGYEVQLKSASTEEAKSRIQNEASLHHGEAELRYKLKSADKDLAKANPFERRTIMVDMQKCLPTPNLTVAESFYLRKLWELNETIYDHTTGKTFCMMWNETVGARGGNEVASCIMKWILTELPKNISHLTIWSDNCAGQNRNINLLLMYLWILRKCPNLKCIDHKFLLKGHTHMEVDSSHAIIERAKKHLTGLQIALPYDWEQFVRSCCVKNPFTVYSMGLLDFLDFSTLKDSPTSPFVSRKKDTEGNPFLISQVVWIQVTSDHPGKIRFKTEFKQDEFKEVDFRRRPRGALILPTDIQPVRKSLKPINSLKFRDLQKLLEWVPDHAKNYYKKLPHTSAASQFPEDASDS